MAKKKSAPTSPKAPSPDYTGVLWPTVPVTQKGRKASTSGDRPSYANIFGKYSDCAFCRWMGAQGYKPKESVEIGRKLGLKMQSGTVAAALYDGRKGKCGPPAPLTESEVKEVEGLRVTYKAFGVCI